MAEIDFQTLLDGMTVSSGQNDPIKSIYNIVPTYDSVQQQLLFQASYFIEKYDLCDMRALFDNFGKIMSGNKNLGFFSSRNLEKLLSAYTQNEYLRGIKVQTLNNVSDITQG